MCYKFLIFILQVKGVPITVEYMKTFFKNKQGEKSPAEDEPEKVIYII